MQAKFVTKHVESFLLFFFSFLKKKKQRTKRVKCASKVDVRRKAARLKKKKREKKYQSRCHLGEKPISRKNKFLWLMWVVEKRVFLRSNYRKALIFECVTRVEVVIGSNEGRTESLHSSYFDYTQPFICTDLPVCNFEPSKVTIVHRDKAAPLVSWFCLRIIILIHCRGESKKRETNLLSLAPSYEYEFAKLWTRIKLIGISTRSIKQGERINKYPF